MQESNFVVTCFDSCCVVGDNRTNHANGLKDFSLLSSSLVIPGVINGTVISQIGFHSFFQLDVLEEVVICKNIKVINKAAFCHNYNLKSIRIPSSVTFIDINAISAKNYSNTSSNLPDQNTKGTMIIEFEPNSKLEVLEKHSIIRKEHIIIYYWDKKSPKSPGNDPFFRESKSKVKIYSPNCRIFAGYPTLHFYSCNRMKCHRSSSFMIYTTVMLICNAC